MSRQIDRQCVKCVLTIKKHLTASWFDWMRCNRKKKLRNMVCPKTKKLIVEECKKCNMNDRSLKLLEEEVREDLNNLLKDAERELQDTDMESHIRGSAQQRHDTIHRLYEEAFDGRPYDDRRRLLLQLLAVQHMIDEGSRTEGGRQINLDKKAQIIQKISMAQGHLPVDIYDYFSIEKPAKKQSPERPVVQKYIPSTPYQPMLRRPESSERSAEIPERKEPRMYPVMERYIPSVPYQPMFGRPRNPSPEYPFRRGADRPIPYRISYSDDDDSE